MHPTRSRLASRFLLLGLIGLYGGAFLFPLSIADQLIYTRPTPSLADALIASWPMLVVIGFGILLLWISHKLDPLAGANRDNLGRAFRGVASVILFIIGLVGIASALLTEVVNVVYGPYKDDTLRSSTPSAIMLVAGIAFLWLSRLASGSAGPVLRYPLGTGKRGRRAT
jgi:hypothetical protein